jgi:cation:H+ antiporter
MLNVIDLGVLVLGMVAVWYGAGLVIDASVRVAKALKIHEAFIGLTILSIGTSLPEIFTHIMSSVQILKGVDASGISVGTNIGSNLVQITLILGVVAIFLKVKAKQKELYRDYMIMIASIVILWLFSLGGYISRIEGAVLTVLYIAYLIYLFKHEHVVAKVESKDHKNPHYWKNSGILAVGFVILLYGAHLVVTKGESLAEAWGIADSVLGALIIGFGTALPELTTAVRGVLKGSSGMSLGTLIGSNITNPLFALGIGAIISGYTVDWNILWVDLPIWFGVSILGFVFFKGWLPWFGKKLEINHKEGMVLLSLYVAYIAFKIYLL